MGALPFRENVRNFRGNKRIEKYTALSLGAQKPDAVKKPYKRPFLRK